MIPVERAIPFDQKRFYCEKFTTEKEPGVQAITGLDLGRAQLVDIDTVCDAAMTHIDLSGFAALWDNQGSFPAVWKTLVPPGGKCFHFCLRGEAVINQYGVKNYFYIRWTPDYYNAKHEQPLKWIWAWDLAPLFNKWDFPVKALVVPRNS